MKAMGEAERSIAVKRKVASRRLRAESPAETYSPKRRCSSVKEAPPPPYTPTKKGLSARHTSAIQAHLSKNDARHILDREERKEIIAQARRKELLKSLGMQNDDKKLTRSSADKDIRDDKSVHYREVRDETTRGRVKNFQITTRVVSGSSVKDRSRSPQTRGQDKLDDAEDDDVEVVAKISASSRLGKVVRRRVPNDEAVTTAKQAKREPRSASTSLVRTAVKEKEGGRIDLKRLGKELLKKQCEAAVLSVKAAEDKAKPDSRVVYHDDEDVVKHPVEESVKPASIKRRSSSNEDIDDLAEMISEGSGGNDAAAEVLDDSLSGEFTLDLEDDGLKVGEIDEFKDEVLQEKLDDKKGTRFIVTLDGMGDDDYGGQARIPEGMKSDGTIFSSIESNYSQREHVVYDALAAQAGGMSHPVLQHTQMSHPILHAPAPPPQPAHIMTYTPPIVQPFSISLKDSDDEHDNKSDYPTGFESGSGGGGDAISAVQKAKQSERCRFWPACAVGSACEYHHPTIHCKTFPNCKFGDKCLFIHPNCRFDSKCQRADCPFTHTSRRTGLSAGAARPAAVATSQGFRSSVKPYNQVQPSAPHLTPCRFFPNCHNVNCVFLHPKPCRFGAACHIRSSCPFSHPPLPSKDKLKWQAEPHPAKPRPAAPAITKLTPPVKLSSSVTPKPSEVKVPPAVKPAPAERSGSVSSTSQ